MRNRYLMTLAGLLWGIVPASRAADLTVMSAGAIEPGLHVAVLAFEKESGHKVKVTFNTPPRIRELVAAGETFDVSLPRTENKLGLGHRGFVVNSDPHMDLAAAAARRDYTINAIFWDPAGDRFIDPHDGRLDLRSGLLRHVSEAFAEDPMRLLRLARFAARFETFTVAPETMALMRRDLDVGSVTQNTE